ncbi:unnamed protein product [Agarophyton chilense]
MPSLILIIVLFCTRITTGEIQRDSGTSLWDLISGNGADNSNRFDTDPWDFDVFRSLLELVPSVKATLQTRTDITVFLPSDLGCSQTANDLIALSDNSTFPINDVNTEQHAFYSLRKNWVDRYEDAAEALELWLNYHIVQGAYSSQDVLELGYFTFNTLAQQRLDLVVTRLHHNDPRLPYAELVLSPLSETIVQPNNGLVVVIDRMMFPSFSSLPLKLDGKEAFPSASSSSSSAPVPSISSTPTPTLIPSKPGKPSPSATPIPEKKPTAACFPLSSRVYMRRGVSFPISKLQAGHEVMVSEIESSDVFLFSHRNVHGVYDFIQVTSEHNHTIELSSGHYIYANDRRVPAYTLKEGDLLRTVDGPSRVRRLQCVRAKGLVAPHTLHGDIVIDGVVISTYTTALAPFMAHSALSPLRFLVKLRFSLEPLGTLLYSGAPQVVPWLPSGSPFS